MLCKHYPKMKEFERKHLRMRIFHQNKDDARSRDQNKNEFNFVSLTMKTNFNIIFFTVKRNLNLGKFRFGSHLNTL